MHYDNVKFLNNGFFDRINEHKTYVLDSNVVIKLRDLFYNPQKMSIEEINYYIGLLEYFRDKDVLPGPAMQELSWNFEHYELDQVKYIRLADALDTLFSYDYFTISRIKAQSKYVSDTKPVKGSRKSFKNLSLNIEANLYLLPSLCIMLKYHQVVKKYNDNRSRYIEICNFSMNELKLIGAYELTLITELLFSSSDTKTNMIKNMLKIDGSDNYLRQVWNSCWDIFFLRYITAAAANTLSFNSYKNIYNPVLVTRDKNLFTIGNMVQNNKDVVINRQVLPGITGSYDYTKDAKELIDEMNQNMLRTSEERLKAFDNMNHNQRISHWRRIIQELEEDLCKRC